MRYRDLDDTSIYAWPYRCLWDGLVLMVSSLAGRLPGRLPGWLAGWLIGRFVRRLTRSPHMITGVFTLSVAAQFGLRAAACSQSRDLHTATHPECSIDIGSIGN